MEMGTNVKMRFAVICSACVCAQSVQLTFGSCLGFTCVCYRRRGLASQSDIATVQNQEFGGNTSFILELNGPRID
jgi:hypothetical protein